MEQKYRLHPAEGQKKAEEWKLRPVDAAKGDIRRQIADTVKPLLKLYRFQSMGEFRALLSLYNIGMEEVRGEAGGRAYHGIVYAALDADGNKVATPIKSARLGRITGAEGLQRRMEWSASRIRTDGCRERLRPLLAGALQAARDEADFRRRLAAMNVDLVLRRNESGRIYGVTFIDHTSRTVLNGSGSARSSPPMCWKRVSTRNPNRSAKYSLTWQRLSRKPVRTVRYWEGCCPSLSRKPVPFRAIRACTSLTRRNAAQVRAAGLNAARITFDRISITVKTSITYVTGR